MIRKVSIILIIALASVFFLAGCSDDGASSKIPDKTAVSDSGDKKTAENSDDSDHGADSSPDGNSSDSAGNDSDLDVDVDITEKMYVAYINEIYVNAEDYIGQTIRIQGMFQAYTDEETGNTYYYVYRTGPGCCGNDGAMCGFEFTWDGRIPENNDWIEVVGSLRSYEDDGWTYLTLDAKAVTVMEERGAETVLQ